MQRADDPARRQFGGTPGPRWRLPLGRRPRNLGQRAIEWSRLAERGRLVAEPDARRGRWAEFVRARRPPWLWRCSGHAPDRGLAGRPLAADPTQHARDGIETRLRGGGGWRRAMLGRSGRRHMHLAVRRRHRRSRLKGAGGFGEIDVPRLLRACGQRLRARAPRASARRGGRACDLASPAAQRADRAQHERRHAPASRGLRGDRLGTPTRRLLGRGGRGGHGGRRGRGGRRGLGGPLDRSGRALRAAVARPDLQLAAAAARRRRQRLDLPAARRAGRLHRRGSAPGHRDVHHGLSLRQRGQRRDRDPLQQRAEPHRDRPRPRPHPDADRDRDRNRHPHRDRDAHRHRHHAADRDAADRAPCRLDRLQPDDGRPGSGRDLPASRDRRGDLVRVERPRRQPQ